MNDVMHDLWVGSCGVVGGGGVLSMLRRWAKVEGKWSRNPAWKRRKSETGSTVWKCKRGLNGVGSDLSGFSDQTVEIITNSLPTYTPTHTLWTASAVDL